MTGDAKTDEPKGSIDTTNGIEVDGQKIEALYTQASLASLLRQEQAKLQDTSRLPSLSSQQIPQERQAAFISYLFDRVVRGEEDLVEGYNIPVEATTAEAYRILAAMHGCGYSEEKIRECFNGIQSDFVEEQLASLQEYSPRTVLGGVGGDYGGALEKYHILPDKDKLKVELSQEEFNGLLVRGANPAFREGRPLAYLTSQHKDLLAEWSTVALVRGEARDYITAASIYAQIKGSAFESEWPEGTMRETTSITLGLRLAQAGEYQPDHFQLSRKERGLLREHHFTVEEMYIIGQNPKLKQNIFEKKPSDTEDSEVPDYLDDIYSERVNIMEYVNYLVREDGCFRSGSCSILQQVDTEHHEDDHDTSYYRMVQDVWDRWRRGRKTIKELQDVLDAWAITVPLEQRDEF